MTARRPPLPIYYLILVLFFQVTLVLAQDPSQVPASDNASVDTSPKLSIRSQASFHGSIGTQPLFIVKGGNRTLEIAPSSGIQTNYAFPSELESISPSMIQDITVVKGQDAIEKYGAKGSRGVIILGLKDGAFEKLPSDLADRFEINK